MRSSITFSCPKDLLAGINHLIDCISNGNGGVIKQILRCKNSFSAIRDGEIKYGDIKFNIKIEYNGVSIIGEVQCLLNWMLQSKLKGHFLYGIARRQEWIHSVVSLMNDDLNKDIYESNVLSTIENCDYNRLGQELIFNCNQMLNMKIMTQQNGQEENKLLLYQLCQKEWPKGVKLFVSAITWYDTIMKKNSTPIPITDDSKESKDKTKNKSQDSSNSFGISYFDNPESLEMDEDGFFAFWGLFATNLKLSRSKYQIMETLLKCPFVEIKNSDLIYHICGQDCFDFLKVIRKYRSSDEGIVKGINKAQSNTGRTPLATLISTSHCSVAWLELLASFDTFDINAKCADGKTALELGLERSKGGKRIKPEGLEWMKKYQSNSKK